MIAKQAIDDFLTQKIQKTIEKKQRSLKGKFGENDKQKIIDNYEIFSWLDKVAENAENIFLNVSHVAKLTHSSSQAMSLKDSIISTKNLHLISNQTINSQFLDSGYSSAALSPIAEFLSFPVSGTNKQLGELLAEDEQNFSQITEDKSKREYWTNQIKQVYQSQKSIVIPWLNRFISLLGLMNIIWFRPCILVH